MKFSFCQLIIIKIPLIKGLKFNEKTKKNSAKNNMNRDETHTNIFIKYNIKTKKYNNNKIHETNVFFVNFLFDYFIAKYTKEDL